LRKWDGTREIEMLIPLKTDNKSIAHERLAQVNRLEKDIKNGTEFSFPWMNEKGETRIKKLRLDEAIDLFLESRTRDNIRPKTIEQNELALRHFMSVMGKSFPIEKVTIHHLETFKQWSMERHSPTTVNMNLRAVRTFLQWLDDNRYIHSVPKTKQVKVDESNPMYLTETELGELFKLDLCKSKMDMPNRDDKGKFLDNRAGRTKGMCYVTDWHHYRRAYWFYLTTGCRLREPFNGAINGNWLDVPAALSKNGKERNIYLAEKQKEIAHEMQDRVAEVKSHKNITDRYSKVFKKACRLLGIDKHFHCLRHTYAVIRRLETNGNILLMRDELGHKSVKTTERYCKIPFRRLEQDFPSYAKGTVIEQKVAKNSFRDTEIRDTQEVKVDFTLG